MTIYDFQVKTLEGEETTLSHFRDHTLLIVNVASKCGLTGQYEALEGLFQKYKDKKFFVLGFPCNQFGSQEPGDESEIRDFCQTRYHVTFPMFSKIEVNGKNTHPLYAFLKSQEKGFLGTEAIKWNFTKFLIDKSGNVLKRYAPQVDPASLNKEIEKLL